MTMPRIAVTGGSGRIGAYAVEALRAIGEPVVVDRVPPPPGGAAAAEHVVCDVLDLAAVRAALAGCESAVHLAAIDFRDGVPAEDYIRVNVLGSWHVLQAAAELGLRRVVICSSTAAYGLFDTAETAPDWLPIGEDHPVRPVRPYGLSKHLVETAARAVARDGPEVVCLRVAMVAFPDMAAEMREAARHPAPGRLFSWVSPEDVATAFRLALSAEVDGFDVFNICAADSYCAEPTLAVYERLYGVLPELRRPDLYREAPNASVFDISRAVERLGFAPRSFAG
jgi:UDP-glucose 4-epimerase